MKINTDIVRLYKDVHTWTGIVAALLLFIVFYAGAITMFEETLERWAAPPAEGIHQVSLGDTSRLIAETLAAAPEARKEFMILLKDKESFPARMVWFEHDTRGAHGDRWRSSFDADGKLVMANDGEPSELAEFVDYIHRTGGIVPTTVGVLVMGVVGLLYGLALISGVIVLLPSLVKDLFLLRVGKNLKRMWLDAHNVIGVFSLPFHIVMAMTAVIFCLKPWIYSALDAAVYEGRQARIIAEYVKPWRAPLPSGVPAQMLPPAELLDTVRERFPGFEPAMMEYANAYDERAMVKVYGTDSRYLWEGGWLSLSPVTGEVLYTDRLPGHRPFLGDLSYSFHSLHMGDYGGVATRWAYFLLGLAGAFLFYGGNLLWIESRRKRARDEGRVEQPRSAYWMGSGTVGVCVGCMAGISLTIVAAKWLHGRVDDLNHWHEYVYYAVFLLSVVWAFLRGAARAGVELLWLTAAATLAIPATTLAAWLFPALGMWAHTSAATLGVDITAFVGGLCFVWMARATARRAHAGSAGGLARNDV